MGLTMSKKTIIKAIKNDIAIYAIHTNLDNYSLGVNKKIGDMLGIIDPKVLSPVSKKLVKLAVFCPTTHSEIVKDALFNAGAGHIGNYNECSFSSEGHGSFRANDNAKPFVGNIGERHSEKEIKIEVIVTQHNLGSVLKRHAQFPPIRGTCLRLYFFTKQK